MGIFKRHATTAVADKPAQATPEPVEFQPPPPVTMDTPAAAPKRRGKAAERLSSVVKESTEGAAVAMMRDTRPFLLEDGTKAAVLMLDATEIGGLSQSQRSDEAKGSIIELIVADHITTLATWSMLDNDKFAIIPTHGTLARMDEFSLLVNAGYHWAVVDFAEFSITESIHSTVASLALARRVDAGEISIEDALISCGINDYARSGDTGAAAVDDGQMEEFEQDFAAGDEGRVHSPTVAYDELDENDPFVDDESEEIDYAALDADDSDDEAEFDDDDDEPDLGYSAAPAHAIVEDNPDEVEPEPVADDGIVVTEDQVRRTITRRFLSEDLGLEVNDSAFESQLSTSMPVVRFDTVPREGDWLSAQVVEIAKLANTDLAAARVEHVAGQRRLYMNLLNEHAEQLTKQLDPDDPTTFFGELRTLIVNDDRTRAERGAELVSGRRAELTARFSEEKRQRGQSAAAAAEAQFQERYGPRLERELADAETEVAQMRTRAKVEAERELLEQRRADAARRMDVGINKVLIAVGARVEEDLAAELQLRQSWADKIQKLIDDNRKNDVARTEALAEQLAQSQRVEQLTADFQARTAASMAEFDRQIAIMHGEIQRVQAQAEARLRSREQQWTQAWQSQGETLQAREAEVNGLSERLANLDKSKDGQYAQRLADLNSENRRLNADAEQSSKMHSRTLRTIVVLMVVLALVTLAIGVLLGGLWLNHAGAAAQVITSVTASAVPR